MESHLSQWQTKRISDIVEFNRDWVEKNKTFPRDYPMSMEDGEWDEQFEFYLDLSTKNT